MLTLIIITALLMVGFILLSYYGQNEYEIWATMGSILTGILLAVLLVVYVANPLMVKIDIKKFKSFELTLENSRTSTLSEYERAAIQTKIADWNEWLADVQYRKTWIINTIPDEVNQLKPIK